MLFEVAGDGENGVGAADGAEAPAKRLPNGLGWSAGLSASLTSIFAGSEGLGAAFPNEKGAAGAGEAAEVEADEAEAPVNKDPNGFAGSGFPSTSFVPAELEAFDAAPENKEPNGLDESAWPFTDVVLAGSGAFGALENKLGVEPADEEGAPVKIDPNVFAEFPVCAVCFAVSLEGSGALGAPKENAGADGAAVAGVPLLDSDADDVEGFVPKSPEKGLDGVAPGADDTGAAKAGFAAKPSGLSLEGFSAELDEKLNPPNGLLVCAAGLGENRFGGLELESPNMLRF